MFTYAKSLTGDDGIVPFFPSNASRCMCTCQPASLAGNRLATRRPRLLTVAIPSGSLAPRQCGQSKQAGTDKPGGGGYRDIDMALRVESMVYSRESCASDMEDGIQGIAAAGTAYSGATNTITAAGKPV